MGPTSAIIIGAVGGVIVVLGVALLDKCKLDDPVGAIPVHLFSGIWGTLAVGIFGTLHLSINLWFNLQVLELLVYFV